MSIDNFLLEGDYSFLKIMEFAIYVGFGSLINDKWQKCF